MQPSAPVTVIVTVVLLPFTTVTEVGADIAVATSHDTGVTVAVAVGVGVAVAVVVGVVTGSNAKLAVVVSPDATFTSCDDD